MIKNKWQKNAKMYRIILDVSKNVQNRCQKNVIKCQKMSKGVKIVKNVNRCQKSVKNVNKQLKNCHKVPKAVRHVEKYQTC